MTIQNAIRRLKANYAGPFPRSKFLMMFIGVVVGPLVLLANVGRNPAAPGIPWDFIAITSMLLAVTVIGFAMFRRDAQAGKVLSISPTHR
jgi:hypothetical protein